MTDKLFARIDPVIDMMREHLIRIEVKLDQSSAEQAHTRASLAAIKEQQQQTAKIAERNQAEIQVLKGFRSWILGAIAAGSALGAGIGAAAAIAVQFILGG